MRGYPSHRCYRGVLCVDIPLVDVIEKCCVWDIPPIDVIEKCCVWDIPPIDVIEECCAWISLP